MTEAALFYELAHPSLGDDFLDDIQFAIASVRDRPKLGVDLGYGFRRVLIRRFPFWPSHIRAEGLTIGGTAHDC